MHTHNTNLTITDRIITLTIIISCYSNCSDRQPASPPPCNHFIVITRWRQCGSHLICSLPVYILVNKAVYNNGSLDHSICRHGISLANGIFSDVLVRLTATHTHTHTHTHHHWRRQLWGTGGRACAPSTFNNLFLLLYYGAI